VEIKQSNRVFVYNRAIFITLLSSIHMDRSNGVKTLLSETWMSIGIFRKNMPLFDFDITKFGKCWSVHLIFAGITFGFGRINERMPLFGY
jgi:hypothetical protein